jgi:PB1 domain/Ig-like domain from next to BRCA1 gene/UBA/TS-N domain
MSLNRKISLKVVRNEEIRIMHVVPNTWTELQAALTEMYGTSEFQVTYIDEEGDNITIASDLDLREAYNYYQEKPSMKLYFKVKPVLEEFEELKIEEALPRPETDEPWKQVPQETSTRGWRCRGRGFFGRGEGICGKGEGSFGRGEGFFGRGEGFFGRGRGNAFCKGMKKYFKKMHKSKFGKHGKHLKLKVLQKHFPKRWIVSSGSSVVIGWSVMNKGYEVWPEGSTIENIRGTIHILEPVKITETRPGEIVNINITVEVPNQQGKHTGIWGLMINGECAGILKAKFYVAAESTEAKVSTLVTMGFLKENAQRALEETQGDLDLAISTMLKL